MNIEVKKISVYEVGGRLLEEVYYFFTKSRACVRVGGEESESFVK